METPSLMIWNPPGISLSQTSLKSAPPDVVMSTTIAYLLVRVTVTGRLKGDTPALVSFLEDELGLKEIPLEVLTQPAERVAPFAGTKMQPARVFTSSFSGGTASVTVDVLSVGAVVVVVLVVLEVVVLVVVISVVMAAVGVVAVAVVRVPSDVSVIAVVIGTIVVSIVFGGSAAVGDTVGSSVVGTEPLLVDSVIGTVMSVVIAGAVVMPVESVKSEVTVVKVGPVASVAIVVGTITVGPGGTIFMSVLCGGLVTITSVTATGGTVTIGSQEILTLSTEMMISSSSLHETLNHPEGTRRQGFGLAFRSPTI